MPAQSMQPPVGMPGYPNSGLGPQHNAVHQAYPPTNQQVWQQPGQLPHSAQQDIMGIAAKAAQALASSQNILQATRPQPPGMPGMTYPGQPQHQYGLPQQPSQQHVAPVRRGRTTAQMHELPIAVQFAVQVRAISL